MINEFDSQRLLQRRHFLEDRASAHLETDGDRHWHRLAAATLLRDAAAVALLLDEFDDARVLLRKSGNQLLQLGLSGGLQLLFIAGAMEGDNGEITERVNLFARELIQREDPELAPRSPERQFDPVSFTSPQLLRTYQGLVGQRSDTALRARQTIRTLLASNASMPVGTTRTPVAIYLTAFDYLAHDAADSTELPLRPSQIIFSLAQRRAELLSIARMDRYHWKALLRPADMIDFDLLAMFVAGWRRQQNFKVVELAFAERDSFTELPAKLAIALNNRPKG